MGSSRLMHKLATSPHLLMKFWATGQLPRETRITSPLIELLERIHAQDRLRMRGVRVSPKIGYAQGARFHNAEQLLNWLKPHQTAIEGEWWPAESHRIKAFRGPVTIQDLIESCDVVPDGMEQKYGRR